MDSRPVHAGETPPAALPGVIGTCRACGESIYKQQSWTVGNPGGAAHTACCSTEASPGKRQAGAPLLSPEAQRQRHAEPAGPSPSPQGGRAYAPGGAGPGGSPPEQPAPPEPGLWTPTPAHVGGGPYARGTQAPPYGPGPGPVPRQLCHAFEGAATAPTHTNTTAASYYGLPTPSGRDLAQLTQQQPWQAGGNADAVLPPAAAGPSVRAGTGQGGSTQAPAPNCAQQPSGGAAVVRPEGQNGSGGVPGGSLAGGGGWERAPATTPLPQARAAVQHAAYGAGPEQSCQVPLPVPMARPAHAR